MVWVRKLDRSRVHPFLLETVGDFESFAAANGCEFKVYSAFRSFAEQDQLYQLGRQTIGRIVTSARAGESHHNYGLAADLAPRSKVGGVYWPPDGAPEWDLVSEFLDQLPEGPIAIEWGGHWQRLKDRPHLQIKISISDLLRGIYPEYDSQWELTQIGRLPKIWGVRRAQHLLGEEDHCPGPLDGIFGPKTIAALRVATGQSDLLRGLSVLIARRYERLGYAP